MPHDTRSGRILYRYDMARVVTLGRAAKGEYMIG
jgi:hypothetical protein